MHHLQFLSHVVLSWDRILLGEVGLSLGRARAEEGAEAPGLRPESRRGRRGDTKKKISNRKSRYIQSRYTVRESLQYHFFSPSKTDKCSQFHRARERCNSIFYFKVF